MTTPDMQELIRLGTEFENKTPQEIIEYSLKKFGDRISLASSFGAEDVVLIDMISGIKQDARVFLLDTGYLFKETHDLVNKLKEKYSFQLDIYTADTSIEEMEKEHGRALFKNNPNLCCEIRKLRPLKKALSVLDAWITGIRRDQTPTRATTKKIEFDNNFNIVKINPIADWPSARVWAYIHENNVPYNVLHDKNYPSIGCEPCTATILSGEDPRSGRWSQNEKNECGLHIK